MSDDDEIVYSATHPEMASYGMHAYLSGVTIGLAVVPIVVALWLNQWWVLLGTLALIAVGSVMHSKSMGARALSQARRVAERLQDFITRAA